MRATILALCDEVDGLRTIIDNLHHVEKKHRDTANDQFHRANRLRAENERLREAATGCLTLLDALVEESGRGIEWGEEDAFRMGEWFEKDDMQIIDFARAALAQKGGE